MRLYCFKRLEVKSGKKVKYNVFFLFEYIFFVQALAGDIVLCSWARHFTLTVPLSTQVYKWVSVNLMLGGNPVMD